MKWSRNLSGMTLFIAAIDDRYFRWWKKNRDIDGSGLVTILHPWESGIDLSPAYDPALGVSKSICSLCRSNPRRTGSAELESSIPSSHFSRPSI